MKTNKKHFWLFDNEGRSFDRYTAILHDGTILAANEYPFAPQGFGQHCGEVTTTVKHYVQEARKNISWLGKEIKDINLIPKDTLTFIADNL